MRGASPGIELTTHRRSTHMKTAAHSFLALLLLFLAGCSGIGPGTVSRDRFDYTEAISDSWKRQMLFNMVKIRYGDAPVFMDVSSVISQYQIAGAINLGATMNQQPSSSSQTLGATGQYVDRPTITFTPILGDKFARSLMSPIPPAAVLSLMQGGYPVDLVFRMLVHEVNGIRNRFGGDARAQSADPEFYALIDKMRRIQLAGGIGMRVTKIDKEAAAVIVIRGKRDPEIEALSKEVRDMLGLDPLTSDINVVYGAIPRDNQEIALLTRSILEVLVDLSADTSKCLPRMCRKSGSHPRSRKRLSERRSALWCGFKAHQKNPAMPLFRYPTGNPISGSTTRT